MTPPPFNGPFSGTTWVSWYQKGETNLDFTEATDSEWQWHQLNHMQDCISLQTDNHASAPPLVFYRPDALPAAQPTASKHWRHMKTTFTTWKRRINFWRLPYRHAIQKIYRLGGCVPPISHSVVTYPYNFYVKCTSLLQITKRLLSTQVSEKHTVYINSWNSESIIQYNKATTMTQHDI